MPISTTTISSPQARTWYVSRSDWNYTKVVAFTWYATIFIVTWYATNLFNCYATKLIAWYVIRLTAGCGTFRQKQSNCS